MFEKESREEIEQRKLDAMKPINIEKRSQVWILVCFRNVSHGLFFKNT